VSILRILKINGNSYRVHFCEFTVIVQITVR
jgi:hypothetical protein